MDFLVAAFVATQIFWAGLMWVSHFCTYPLFAAVSAGDFAALHERYRAGLPLGVYAPFGLTVLAVIAALAVRGGDIAPLWLWLAALAALGGVATTAFGAAPLHIKLIKTGQDQATIRRLLKWNFYRLLFALLGGASAFGHSVS